MDRQSRKVIASRNYEDHLTEILAWGIERFGIEQARRYFFTISRFIERLDTDCTCHPECRPLATKSRMYRNIILDAHLIVYRITDERIEVLDILHAASSARKIRETRNIHL
jgi:plasmid stabilization system protein ParE